MRCEMRDGGPRYRDAWHRCCLRTVRLHGACLDEMTAVRSVWRSYHSTWFGHLNLALRHIHSPCPNSLSLFLRKVRC